VRPALLASSLHPLQLRKPRSHRPAQHPSLHTSLQRVSATAQLPDGSMEAVKRVRSQQPGTAAIALHPAGGVAATGGWDGSVRLYDCALLHRPRPAAHLTHHSAA
ncbi:unnamed protein product, partial [Closterium sp. NIES-64]